MRDFDAYIGAAHRGLNAFERRLDSNWERHDSWLRRHESGLRTALIALLLQLPFDDRTKRLKRSAIDDVRRRRRDMNAEIRRFESLALEWFAGAAGRAADDDTPPPAGGPSSWGWFRARAEATRQTATVSAYEAAGSLLRALFDHAHQALVAIAPPRRTLPDSPPPPEGKPETPLLEDAAPAGAPGPTDAFQMPIAELLEHLRAIGFEPPSSTPAKFWGWFWVNEANILDRIREVLNGRDEHPEDSWLAEQLDNGVSNPVANIRYETRRWIEQLKDVTMGRPRAVDIIAHINGTPRRYASAIAPDIAAGMAVNRNNMRLSTEAHVRGMFRSEIVRTAEAMGIRDFILEYPLSRRDSIRPAGAIALHAHQVRTADEWRAVIEAANAQKRPSATFEAGGLHHGDFTVPIPVPPQLIEDAREYSKIARANLARELGRRAAA